VSRFASELPGIVGALRSLLARIIRKRMVEPQKKFFDMQRMYTNRHVKRVSGLSSLGKWVPGVPPADLHGPLDTAAQIPLSIRHLSAPTNTKAGGPGGLLHVVLLCGRNVAPATTPGASPTPAASADPAAVHSLATYCQLRYGRQSLRTPVLHHTIDPVWNWSFALALPAEVGALAPADDVVQLKVCDAKTVGDPAVLGKCQVCLYRVGG